MLVEIKDLESNSIFLNPKLITVFDDIDLPNENPNAFGVIAPLNPLVTVDGLKVSIKSGLVETNDKFGFILTDFRDVPSNISLYAEFTAYGVSDNDNFQLFNTPIYNGNNIISLCKTNELESDENIIKCKSNYRVSNDVDIEFKRIYIVFSDTFVGPEKGMNDTVVVGIKNNSKRYIISLDMFRYLCSFPPYGISDVAFDNDEFEMAKHSIIGSTRFSKIKPMELTVEQDSSYPDSELDTTVK